MRSGYFPRCLWDRADCVNPWQPELSRSFPWSQGNGVLWRRPRNKRMQWKACFVRFKLQRLKGSWGCWNRSKQWCVEEDQTCRCLLVPHFFLQGMFFSLGGGWICFCFTRKGNFCCKGWNLLILVDLLRLSHVRFASKTWCPATATQWNFLVATDFIGLAFVNGSSKVLQKSALEGALCVINDQNCQEQWIQIVTDGILGLKNFRVPCFDFPTAFVAVRGHTALVAGADRTIVASVP